MTVAKVSDVSLVCLGYTTLYFHACRFAGTIELREDTVENLLATACMLQLSEVVEACCNFLMKQLHPSNCIGIRQFADAQGCSDLYKVANNYVMVSTLISIQQICLSIFENLNIKVPLINERDKTWLLALLIQKHCCPFWVLTKLAFQLHHEKLKLSSNSAVSRITNNHIYLAKFDLHNETKNRSF